MTLPLLMEEYVEAMHQRKEELKALYRENKKITDDNYDKSLAVKCVNGTFVGRKVEDIIEYRGIPFVGKQPVGELRWKAPVDYAADDGVYEAYTNGKTACQRPVETASVQGEDCLYLNIWKAEDAGAGGAKAAHPAPAPALTHPCVSRKSRSWCGFTAAVSRLAQLTNRGIVC